MFLGKIVGKKIKSHSVEIAFKLPEKIEPDRLVELVQKLRTGDLSVSKEIFLGHLGLIISIAGKYYYQTQADKINDIVSEAMIGCAYAINKAQNNLIDDNITPYIAMMVHGRINKFIIEDKTIRINKQKLASDPTIVLKSIAFNLEDAYYVESQGYLEEILEQIEHIIKNDPDVLRQNIKREIIRLRTLSYKDIEIAQILNISKQYVWKLRQEIKEEYNKLEE